MGTCPNCSEKIDFKSLCLSAFPLYFKCHNCNLRLKLVDSTPFWAVFFLCLFVMIPLIFYVPFVREYGLGVFIGVFGWLVLFYKVLPYLLRKGNLAIYE